MEGVEHKYVRLRESGFILFTRNDDLYHRHIYECAGSWLPMDDVLVSAGFAIYMPLQRAFRCYGKSESIDKGSLPEDSELLSKQLLGFYRKE